MQENNIRPLYIPPNLTHIWQPLDMGVHGPLKSIVRRQWKVDRLADPFHRCTLADAVRGIDNAVAAISKSVIVSSFKKACNVSSN